LPTTPNILLAGNPNIGKTSLFNQLTGLTQKVTNYPGVTVEVSTGKCQLSPNQLVTITDLPGTYSLYPRRADEWVSYNNLLNPQTDKRAQAIILLLDACNLKRNLLYASQLLDLKYPMVVALTMHDVARRKGIRINLAELQRELGVPIVITNPRKGKGIDQLKKTLEQTLQQANSASKRADFIQLPAQLQNTANQLQKQLQAQSGYEALHYLMHCRQPDFIHLESRLEAQEIAEKISFNTTKFQAQEILLRYQRINAITKTSVSEPGAYYKKQFTDRLDNLLLHRTWGYVIMFAVLFLLFQSIFWLAQYPMDAIETSFAWFTSMVQNYLPNNWFGSFITNGLLAGLSGIMVFVPQIIILFGLITVLEDSGYMARISFLSDRVMRQVGLNGKSIMPLVGGFACAVPSIMSARNIENRKERLLTILVTPLISCSARLPVYTVLIQLVVPKTKFLGFIGLQGLVLTALYVFSIVLAFGAAYIFKWLVKIKDRSIFLLELPTYQMPRWNNIVQTMWQRAKIFVTDAGKVIMIISIALWALSSFGPGNKMQKVKEHYAQLLSQPQADTADVEKQQASALLANSYAGHLGHFIEPAIKPLGYDWKIGIALITSFAAREVFVGTMATLYSVEEADENKKLTEKMAAATFANGAKVYTPATGFSLLIFYAIALQCISTFSIVRRETNSWKWPLVQLIAYTALAYVFAFIAYNIINWL
jgi:ferrous iron transport protein B